MLLGTLAASLLGNLSTGGKGIMRAGDGIVRAGSGLAGPLMKVACSKKKKKSKFTVTFSSFNKYKNK